MTPLDLATLAVFDATASATSRRLWKQLANSYEVGAMLPHANEEVGGVDGERTPPGELPHDQHTRGAPDAGARNPLGNERDEALQHVGGAAGDEPVKTDDVLERFTRETRLRFREGSGTPRVYAQVFRRFAGKDEPGVNLEAYSKQAIAGKKGRLLLLDYLARIPEKSRRVNIAALRCIWVSGLGLPFPLDMKRDLGRLPAVGRRKTPADDMVRPWAEAAAKEKDSYTKAFILCELQFGWRPANQVGHLRWHHIRYTSGHMDHVEADGTEARFKSPAPIVAHLPEDVREALEAWRATSPATGEDDFIFPWRGFVVERGQPRRFETHPKEPQTEATIWRMWNAFRRKHDLPGLRPVDLRHFVKTGLRRLGLSDPATAAWQGHKATEGGMRAVYDNPENEALLDEQATVAPRGPVALLVPPEVRDDAALPPEYLRILLDHMAGKISDFEAAAALGKARIALAKDPGFLQP